MSESKRRVNTDELLEVTTMVMPGAGRCPRCGERGRVIGQPDPLRDSGVPMRCYEHGGYSWLSRDPASYEEARWLVEVSKAYAFLVARDLLRPPIPRGLDGGDDP